MAKTTDKTVGKKTTVERKVRQTKTTQTIAQTPTADVSVGVTLTDAANAKQLLEDNRKERVLAASKGLVELCKKYGVTIDWKIQTTRTGTDVGFFFVPVD